MFNKDEEVYYLDSIFVLKQRVKRYEEAIRKHKDQKGDDRCWMDDEELYSVLPEGYIRPERDSCVELELCKKFIKSRHNPNIEYVSPEREIEKLKKEIEESKDKIRNELIDELIKSATDKEIEYNKEKRKNRDEWIEKKIYNHKDGFLKHNIKLWSFLFFNHYDLNNGDYKKIRELHGNWKDDRELREILK